MRRTRFSHNRIGAIPFIRIAHCQRGVIFSLLLCWTRKRKQTNRVIRYEACLNILSRCGIAYPTNMVLGCHPNFKQLRHPHHHDQQMILPDPYNQPGLQHAVSLIEIEPAILTIHLSKQLQLVSLWHCEGRNVQSNFSCVVNVVYVTIDKKATMMNCYTIF